MYVWHLLFVTGTCDILGLWTFHICNILRLRLVISFDGDDGNVTDFVGVMNY